MGSPGFLCARHSGQRSCWLTIAFRQRSAMAMKSMRGRPRKIIKGKMLKKMIKSKRLKKKLKIAKGRLAKFLVISGRRSKTTGGLTKQMLKKNKRGKIVSKKQSVIGKARYCNVAAWVEAFISARH